MRTLIIVFALAALPVVQAHHSLTDYDLGHPVTVTGTVSKIEWMNPHAWLYVDVDGPDGAKQRWAFEFGSPSESIRRGWNRRDLKDGDTVTVQGVLAKRGGNTASARSIKLPDGREVFTGPRK